MIDYSMDRSMEHSMEYSMEHSMEQSVEHSVETLDRTCNAPDPGGAVKEWEEAGIAILCRYGGSEQSLLKHTLQAPAT